MDELYLWALPIVAALAGWEAWRSARRRDAAYHAEDAIASALVGVGHLWASAGWRLLTFPLLSTAFEATPLLVPLSSVWWWLLLFLLGDFVAYLSHRASHDVGALWASHVVHHSSNWYNLTTALRQPWTAGAFEWVFWLPLAFLGFHPVAILVVQAALALYHVALHSAYIGWLGPLELVLNTPGHHRIHHARETELRESNYGAVLIVWDRLLGTFVSLGDEEPMLFGLPRPVLTHNPLAIALHGWRRLAVELWQARGVRAAMSVLAGGPNRGLERVS